MIAKTSRLDRIAARMLISDRLWMKSIYESTAKVVRADGIVDDPVIITIEDFVAVHKSVKAFVSAGFCTVLPRGECPALLSAIDEAISPAVDACRVKMTAENREFLARKLEDVAWTGLGGDE